MWESWLSLCYVEQASAPSSASICVVLEESRATRLPNEERTGPGPKGSRSNSPVSSRGGIAPVNSRRQTAHICKLDPNLSFFLSFSH